MNSEKYKFKFFPIKRKFRKPLKTNHGNWEFRESIIICLTNHQGKNSWSEISPLPWFGSETVEDALAFCHELGEKITKEEIVTIPDNLPSCQFAFESAWLNLESKIESKVESQIKSNQQLNYSYLLPSGKEALTAWQTGWKQGRNTFKWKIGVNQIQEEIELFWQLISLLPTTSKLRLDANGGLNLREVKEWLKATDKTKIVEFIEQPLSPEYFETMLDLKAKYSTELALDESVANFKQLQDCYGKGWGGIFVIKPAIFGFPSRLEKFCQQSQIDMVFSSVFETKVGRKIALYLAEKFSNPNRAVGFGVEDWFEDNENNYLDCR